MARTTLAQLEATIFAQANAYAVTAAALATAIERIGSLELQLAHLQLAKPEPAAQVAQLDPCASVANWKMEYVKYRAITGNTPTADDVRGWIRAGRPESWVPLAQRTAA
jgi:hypothetical protein